MNKKILFFSILSILLFVVTSCNDDDDIKPGTISNIRSEAREGAVMLRWDVPADSNYYYIEISYNDPWRSKTIVKKSSVYPDSVLITGLLNRIGDYKFSLRPYSSTFTPGEVLTYEAGCDPLEASYSVISETPVSLKAENLYTNAQETSEGPIANLLDDNADTHFHSTWNSPPPGPHYLQINLDKALSNGGFKFKYRNRKNANNKPTEIDIMISEDGENFIKLKTLTEEADGLPTASGSEYTSPVLNLLELLPEDEYFEPKSIRFNINKTNNGTVFFTMADFWLWDDLITVYDPENDLEAKPIDKYPNY